MLGVIANPVKTISIDMPCEKVMGVMPLIPILHKKYKKTSADDLLKLFVFEATELLSLGVYIDVTLTSNGESKTDITVEVKRKIGAFDKRHEVQLANDHISKVFELISLSLKKNDAEIEQLIAESKEEPKNLTTKEKNIKTNKKIFKVFGYILLIMLAVSIIYLISA